MMKDLLPTKLRKTLSALLGGCMILSSCTVGPEYKPDRMKLPDHFSSEPHPATPEEIAKMEAGLKDWWKRFNDPILNELIAKTIKGNYDLKAATEHIRIARAKRRSAQADWYPQLDMNVGGGDQRESTIIDSNGFRPNLMPPAPLNPWAGNPSGANGGPGWTGGSTGSGDPTGTFHGHGFHNGVWSTDGRPPGEWAEASVLTYGATGNWELDVFGRIARQVQVQTRQTQASIEDRRGVLLSLLSQVANDYVVLRGTQERIQVVENAIVVAQGAYDLVNRLYLRGVGNNLVVAQAASELHSEKARLPRLHAQEQYMKFDLAMLMGEMPGEKMPNLDRVQAMPKVPAYPATLPSIVLANRPDVREAERTYAMTMANIGVAVAQLYPKFDIPINFHPNASAAYQAFTLYGMAWQFMLMSSIPVLHGGKYSAQIARARAAADGAKVRYRQTVLGAFREMEDRMTDWTTNEEFVKERNEAQIQAVLARDRARRLFAHGVTNFLNVLETESTALVTKDEWVLARIQRIQDAIGLYIAMGAGWQGDDLVDSRLPIEKHDQGILARAFQR